MRLSLAPIAYYWHRDRVLGFYADVAAAPVDIVYLGETVCSRRRELRWTDWLEIATMLEAAGKEVVLSSLALIEAEADLRRLRRLADQQRFRVEANDMGAVGVLAQREAGPPFVAGSSLNVFGPAALALLRDCGATRWVAPAELSRDGLRALLAAARPGIETDIDTDIETEVLAHGRLPLAHSARCFTARHYELQRDACEYRCIDHPDGLALRTREGQPFLTLNGVQTQSASIYSLIAELPQLREAGVDVVRLSPQATGTLALIDLFRDALDGRVDATGAAQRLATLLPGPRCNGFWHDRPGADLVEEAT